MGGHEGTKERDGELKNNIKIKGSQWLSASPTKVG